MFDWQAIAVAVIIFAALIYTGRRAWSRLKSLRARHEAASSACETGCGTCGDMPKPAASERTVFVEISRSRPSARSKQH